MRNRYYVPNFQRDRILSSLGTAVFGRSVRVYDSVDSTNDVLRRLAGEGEDEGSLVVAEEQTKGRGRLGRKWFSPRGSGIWMSVLLRPAIPPRFAPGLSLAASLAVARGIRKSTGLPALVKWPNDVLVSGKKVAGILTEMEAELDEVRFIVLGMGINVSGPGGKLPEEVRACATNLARESGGAVDRHELLASIIGELEAIYFRFCRAGLSSLIEEWKGMTGMWGRRVSVKSLGRIVEGAAHDVDETGALVVRLDSGLHETILSGDIAFL